VEQYAYVYRLKGRIMTYKKSDWFEKDTFILLDFPYLPKNISDWVTEEYNSDRGLSNGSYIELNIKEIKETPLFELLEKDLEKVNKIIIKYWW
jgi:hypothetical protein